MQTASLRFFSATLAAICFLTFAAPHRARAEQGASASSASSMRGGYTTDHVLLTDPEAIGIVDVTSTLYTTGGQTYAVLHGNSIAIVIGAWDGNVYNTSGGVIGFILRVETQAAEPEAEKADLPAALSCR